MSKILHPQPPRSRTPEARAPEIAQQAHGLLQPQPSRRAKAPWVAVSGGKGGVGKTLLAVNLGLSLAKGGLRVLLVDLDPGLANVDVHLRIAPQWTIEDLAEGRCAPEAAVVTAQCGLHVLAGRSGSTVLSGGDAGAIDRVINAIDRLSINYDLVLCDTGAGIGPLVLATAARADRVIAVTTPEPSSITDTYALCKVLHSRDVAMPHLVMNRVETRDQAMSSAAKLRTVAEKFLGETMQTAGWMRRDGLLELSAVDQRPFAIHGTGPAMEDLRGLCANVMSAVPGLTGRRRTEEPARPKTNPLLVRRR